MRWSDRFYLGFIDALKSHPCLYDRVCIEFYDEDLRDRAYTKLLSKVKRRYPLCTKTYVMKTVSSIRCRYRRESGKMEECRQDGIYYKPKLRHFEALDFLKESREEAGIDQKQVAREPVKKSGLVRRVTRPRPVRRPRGRVAAKAEVTRVSAHISFCADFVTQMEQLPENVALVLQKLTGEALFLARTGNLSRFSRCVAPDEEETRSVVPVRRRSAQDQDYSGFCFYLEEELGKLPGKAALTLRCVLYNCLFLAKKGKISRGSKIV